MASLGLNVCDGDLVVRGTLRPTALAAPESCIGDDNVNGSDPITALKLQHQHSRTVAQAHGSAAAAERRVIHQAYGAVGALAAIRAGVVVAAVGGATVTVDVQKNGTTVLTAPISITNSTAAYGVVNGAIATAAYVTGDVFEVVITVAAGGGTLPQGVWVDLVTREDAS